MSVIEEKKALRTFIRKKERTLDPTYKAESSEAICRHLLALDEYKSAKVVFAFASTEKEIDTSLFMNETIAAGKTLILPAAPPSMPSTCASCARWMTWRRAPTAF